MARPRIFVSSTYYDLKYIRSSLEIFIQSLGYDAILSEKGDIAYTPDVPLDESCYREAQNSDVYVLIIGGRYGSEISETKTSELKSFYDRYESITKQEYKSAIDKDIPIYVLIEKAVHSEYQTFRKNRDNKEVKYAHVDSVNIFHFVEEILAQTRNNPVHTFDQHSEIEAWLREQWAGLFSELIQRMSSQQQLASLSTQVAGLAEINKTLKRYLEALLVSEAPDKSKKLISTEAKRLDEANKAVLIKDNPLVSFIKTDQKIPLNLIQKALVESDNIHDFLERLTKHSKKPKDDLMTLERIDMAQRDFIDARSRLGLPVTMPNILERSGKEATTTPSRAKSSKKPVPSKRALSATKKRKAKASS